MALGHQQVQDRTHITYTAFMAPPCVELELVHIVNGQHKFQFDKESSSLPKINCLEGEKHYRRGQLYFSGRVIRIKQHLVDLKEKLSGQ